MLSQLNKVLVTIYLTIFVLQSCLSVSGELEPQDSIGYVTEESVIRTAEKKNNAAVVHQSNKFPHSPGDDNRLNEGHPGIILDGNGINGNNYNNAGGEMNGNDDGAKPKVSSNNIGFIHAFVASLSVILVSELGDKTFFIAAIMAMRHPRLTVFAGAIGALALMTVLSAVFGMAATIVPRVYTYYISTALFAIFGLKMLKEGYYMSANEGQEELEEVQMDIRKREDELMKTLNNDAVAITKKNEMIIDNDDDDDVEVNNDPTLDEVDTKMLPNNSTNSCHHQNLQLNHKNNNIYNHNVNCNKTQTIHQSLMGLHCFKNGRILVPGNTTCNVPQMKLKQYEKSYHHHSPLPPTSVSSSSLSAVLWPKKKESNMGSLSVDNVVQRNSGCTTGSSWRNCDGWGGETASAAAADGINGATSTDNYSKRLEKEVAQSMVITQDPESGVVRKTKRNVAWYLLSRVLMQSFTMTFLAEWGDRSQLTTIILAARENVYGVIVGGVLGHSVCTGIAVLGGRMIAQKISVRTVTLVGGAVFLIFAVSALFMSPEEDMPSTPAP